MHQPCNLSFITHPNTRVPSAYWDATMASTESANYLCPASLIHWYFRTGGKTDVAVQVSRIRWLTGPPGLEARRNNSRPKQPFDPIEPSPHGTRGVLGRIRVALRSDSADKGPSGPP